MSGNKRIVLIMGPPNMGKTTALMTLANQDKMVYLNTDLKDLPFAAKFMASVDVPDAMLVLDYIAEIENNPACAGGVLDTATHLMNMYEAQYVLNAADTRTAWGNYSNFYRHFIHAIKSGSKDYAIMAHEDIVLNEQTMQMESKVPIKGAVGRIGMEADFTTILTARRISVKQLEGHENSLLNITDDEREDDEKCVFVTRSGGAFKGTKSRSAMGLWDRSELYIDNNLQQVFDRLKQYYGTQEAAA